MLFNIYPWQVKQEAVEIEVDAGKDPLMEDQVRDVLKIKDIDNKLCENIRIFIKNHKSTNPGANKVVYGPCEQESEEKNFKF